MCPTAPSRSTSAASLIVPLIVQRDLLGYIYADIDGAFGRFHDGDRDLLAMLASQAAVALANVRFAEGLERKVAERTAELSSAPSELTIINSIQQGMAAELNFQAIVDLVGDKLREVLKTQDIGIGWSIRGPARASYLTSTSTASACDPPGIPEPGGTEQRMRRHACRWSYNSAPSSSASGMACCPAPTWRNPSSACRSSAATACSGSLQLENHEREHAFGDAEVRLLQTVASSMGVALENARLFDETQRLLKETEQRAAEMAVINSIQQGIAGELDFQAIVDLVGDKLREVLKTDDIGIDWYRPADRTAPLPLRVRARRTPGHRAEPPTPGGLVETIARRANAVVLQHAWPSNWPPASPSLPGTDRAMSLAAGAHHRQRPRARHHRARRTTSASTPSANPRSGCSDGRSPAWASRWRTRACSRRSSAARARARRSPKSGATSRRRSTCRR